MNELRAKDKWGSETEGHKTNGEVDKMDSTNIELRFSLFSFWRGTVAAWKC